MPKFQKSNGFKMKGFSYPGESPVRAIGGGKYIEGFKNMTSKELFDVVKRNDRGLESGRKEIVKRTQEKGDANSIYQAMTANDSTNTAKQVIRHRINKGTLMDDGSLKEGENPLNYRSPVKNNGGYHASTPGSRIKRGIKRTAQFVDKLTDPLGIKRKVYKKAKEILKTNKKSKGAEVGKKVSDAKKMREERGLKSVPSKKLLKKEGRKAIKKVSKEGVSESLQHATSTKDMGFSKKKGTLTKKKRTLTNNLKKKKPETLVQKQRRKQTERTKPFQK